MRRRFSTKFIPALFVILAFAVLGVLKGSDGKLYRALEKAFYLSAEDTVWVRPGLNLKITNVSIPQDRKPVVTFKITDDKNQPLDRDAVFTPGEVTSNFCIAYIPADGPQYVNYITQEVTSPITGKTAKQPTTDSGGKYVSFGDGVYSYTYATALPANYDRSATHSVGIFSTRDLTQFNLSLYVANDVYNFVPDGRAVGKVREVVATENCNQCHNPMNMHEGERRDTRLCILCHSPQNTDPNTGNTLDFKVLVHKIHMGANLPSVKAGKPYQIIGNDQDVSDFSTVVFPRDIRSCTTCHVNTSQANSWMLKPSRAVCGACHDDVNFDTGDKHAAGAQADDKKCASCHQPEGEFEYDASIAGSHTVPYKSALLRKPKFEILDVTNTKPGDKPVVRFKITDKDGKAIAPSGMNSLSMRLAGPTTDYSWYVSETATGAAYANGIGTYTFNGSIPAGATGSYSVGIQGRVDVTLAPGTPKAFVYRDGGNNVVKEFAVTGSLVPRRIVVEVARCNKCHERLQLHGNSRNDPAYCVGCHNPTLTDTRRPAASKPDQSVHFKVLIHRIHTGEELTTDYTIWGGSANNFNEVRFPGDRRDCTTCHVGTSYMLPLQSGLLSTSTPSWSWTPTRPIAASCLGCHDSTEAAAHASVNTASFGESCVVCHKEGADFAVSKVHAR